MLGNKTGNSIDGGDRNVQAGTIEGSVTVGFTLEQHEAVVQQRLAKHEELLERAHGAEKELLGREADALRQKLSDIELDYQQRVQELADHKANLANYHNQISDEKLEAAYFALDRDDTSLAEALFKEVAEQIRLRREDDEKEEAAICLQLGKIAEGRVDWHDAATHYTRAARLDPDFETLFKAREYAWRAGQLSTALRLGEDLLSAARNGGSDQQVSRAANEHALTLTAIGRYKEAEPLTREALKIGHKVLGMDHPDYAICLNNLANLLRSTGRDTEAELLYREALEIDRKALGTDDPDYAIDLSNLAGLLQATGRYDEAEPMFREALEIGRKTLGVDHPNYAIRLINLAGLLRVTGRYGEAEPLYREALEITRKKLGKDHPDYATGLNNLAGLLRTTGRYDEVEPLYREALEICEKTFGPEHSNTVTASKNLETFLADHPN